MNFGFNSNVRVGNALYHVQTEDRGPAHPFLDTVVYVAGRVVHKRSTSYEDLNGGAAEQEALANQLHERLSQQHREVMAQLEAGTLQLNEPGGAPAKVVAAASGEDLEVRLLNPKTWLEAGKATLEVELRNKVSETAIGGADVEAFLEADKKRSAAIRTCADTKGHAILSFPLPSAVADGTALVIRATDGEHYAELRFRLKAKRDENDPAPASK
ncbi:MAG: hypothetical protein JWN92_2545 [Candidatus Acidoferrum typicum]|jgi:hypothetical protein|nr:hypothetical protein [Candidatus Acidoferrum typicum]